MPPSTQSQSATPSVLTDTAQTRRKVKVWDFPTRAFHWSLVAVMTVAWLSSEADGQAFWIHIYVGTLLIGFVAFRVVWGVIGSRHARFDDFVRGPDEVSSYARRLLAFRPPFTLGHNPLGGWMVMALLAGLLLVVLSGFMLSQDGYVGPLSGVASGAIGKIVSDVHEGFANGLLVLIFAHVGGVLAHGFISRENLPRAMITGDKQVRADEPGEDIKPVGWLRPVLALVIAAGVVVYFVR